MEADHWVRAFKSAERKHANTSLNETFGVIGLILSLILNLILIIVLSTIEIKNLFSDFQSKIFNQLYYLTKLNEVKMPKLFLSGLINLLIFLIILIISLLIFVIKPDVEYGYYWSISLVSFFIANTVDLVVIIWLALKTELTIKDFYKI